MAGPKREITNATFGMPRFSRYRDEMNQNASPLYPAHGTGVSVIIVR